MLLDNVYNIIHHIQFKLLFENDVQKTINIKTDDIVDVKYREDGQSKTIIGRVSKIECNFNSSLGHTGSSIYMVIDGSHEYSGEVKHIRPDQVLDLDIIKTSSSINNPVTSVDNEDQKIILIRENEIGKFQYSLDGIVWKDINGDGPAGKSAYEIAVLRGFSGTEDDWLKSLRGEQGPMSTISPKRVYYSKSTMLADKSLKLNDIVVLVDNETGYMYIKSRVDTESTCSCFRRNEPQPERNAIDTFTFIGKVSRGEDGKSAYDIAVEYGFDGTPEQWLNSLKHQSNNSQGTPNTTPGPAGKSAYEIAKENGFTGTEQEWLTSLKGTPGENGTNGTSGKSAYQLAKENGFTGTLEEWLASLKGTPGENGKSAYQVAKENNLTDTTTALDWIKDLYKERINYEYSDTPVKIGTVLGKNVFRKIYKFPVNIARGASSESYSPTHNFTLDDNAITILNFKPIFISDDSKLECIAINNLTYVYDKDRHVETTYSFSYKGDAPEASDRDIHGNTYYIIDFLKA